VRAGLSCGLGLLLAGAVLHAALGAQVPDSVARKRPDSTTLKVPLPARGDSLLLDSLAKIAARDSARKAAIKADTIKPPLAHAEMPTEFGIARRLHWNRDSLFATGAITLADLLQRVTGVSTFTAGWVASPAIATYMGETRRVRVFYDGEEYQPLDPRSRGVIDLTQFNLWSAEDVTIEQAADEVRVYVRTWRVRNTTPETRTDASTGDQQTNMYRGFFGRRFVNGLALQFGAQQFGTTPPSILGSSSDQTGIIGRVGWASKSQLSVDAYLARISRHRGTTVRFSEFLAGDSLPSVNSSRSDAYIRVGFADPDTSRLWWQAMAIASKYAYTGIRDSTILNPQTAADTAFNARSLDTAVSRPQYLLTAGTVRGALRLSASERFFTGGQSRSTPSVRGSYALGRLGLSAFAEGKSADSVSRRDVSAQFAALSFLNFLGSVGQSSDSRVKDSSYTAKYLRAEAGLRIRNLWLIGGVLRRDSVRNSPPRIFDTAYTAREDGPATGTIAAIRGQLWRLINADVSAIRWNDTTGFYRPRYQTRSELFIRTNMLDKFPTGDLGISASLVHEYRSSVIFPFGAGTQRVPGYRTFSSLLEIRILSATISWQFRNFLGERYAQVPGFLAPRQTNFYGVRWSFFD
jgi:hypothetical protein